MNEVGFDQPKSELEPESEREGEPVFPTDSCEEVDVDIEPLSGKPFCHVVLKKSHVGDAHSVCQLKLPAHFSRVLPNKRVPIILTRGERSWETTYHGTHKKFDIRWKVFVKDNKLKVGDVCVFEAMECNDSALKFKVQVLRGDFPCMLLDKED
ncbi:hypothetical protein SOVF_203370, partial [Spinacia oleracea]